MAEIVPTSEGGVAGFRIFRPRKGGALFSLTAGYEWRPGPQAASCMSGHQAMPLDRPEEPWDWVTNNQNRIPVFTCGCGFWAYKSYRQLMRYLHHGGSDVLGLVEMWGKMVPGEYGLRSEFAEISAIVRPYDDLALEGFPEETIRDRYGVDIVDLGEVSAVMKELGLLQLKWEPAPPCYQWYTPNTDSIEWLPEENPSSTGKVRLPVAATHPDEELPEYGLAKGRFRDDESGLLYAYWWHADPHARRDARDREKFHSIRGLAGSRSMELHVEEK